MEKGNYLIHLPQTTEKKTGSALQMFQLAGGDFAQDLKQRVLRGEKINTGYKWIVGKGMPCRVSTAEKNSKSNLLKGTSSESLGPKGFSRLSIPN